MDDTSTELKMKVWLPDGTEVRVKHVNSSEAHFGNLVAEGFMDKDEYFPELYQDYKKRHKKVSEDYYQFKKKLEQVVYAKSWVERFLDYHSFVES